MGQSGRLTRPKIVFFLIFCRFLMFLHGFLYHFWNHPGFSTKFINIFGIRAGFGLESSWFQTGLADFRTSQAYHSGYREPWVVGMVRWETLEDSYHVRPF